jgi:hypothetical protein
MPLLKAEPFMEGFVNRTIKKRKRAAFELSREQFQGAETEFIKLYDDAGTIMGQLAYTMEGDGTLNVQVITVMDWGEDAAAIERLLKFVERVAKRKKAKSMKAELYMSDAKTTDKIERMKQCGWEMQDVGRMGQRSSYTLVRRLRGE